MTSHDDRHSTGPWEALSAATTNIPKIVYHYCGPEGLLGIIRSRKLWATSSQFLNDQTERSFASERVVDLIRQRPLAFLNDLSDEEYEHHAATYLYWADRRDPPAVPIVRQAEKAAPYLACFSEQPDLLSQWRAYCPPSGGFAVGLRPSGLVRGSDSLLGKCLYESSEQSAMIEGVLGYHPRLLEQNVPIDQLVATQDGEIASFTNVLSMLLSLLKHPGFREEREWRFVRGPNEASAQITDFRVSRGLLIPFQRIELIPTGNLPPIAEVIIGPGVDAQDRTLKATRLLLDENDLQSCEVKLSKVPYRGW